MYSPLRSRREIRLVQIELGLKLDKVRCTLVEGCWDSSSYEAPSYVWGTKSSVMQVNGKDPSTTSSLYKVITHLRDTHSTRTLWIDALCINQKDEKEKSEQVQQMREIYARARRTVVWLGEDPRGSWSHWHCFSESSGLGKCSDWRAAKYFKFSRGVETISKRNLTSSVVGTDLGHPGGGCRSRNHCTIWWLHIGMGWSLSSHHASRAKDRPRDPGKFV